MNVTIQWAKGAPPDLSVHNETNHRIRSVDLTGYNDRDRLHEMMIENGFRKRTEEELMELQQQKIAKRKRDIENAEKRRAKKIAEQEEARRRMAEEQGRPLAEGEEDAVRIIDKKVPKSEL